MYIERKYYPKKVKYEHNFKSRNTQKKRVGIKKVERIAEKEDNCALQHMESESDIEVLTCIAQHIKAYHKQCMKEEAANWGEACADCKYVEKCKGNWATKIMPLYEKTGVTLQLCYPKKSE